MDSKGTEIAILAAKQKKISIHKYTNEQLAKTDLKPEIKLKLVAINQDNRLSIIMRVQKHTLENVFKKYPKEFYTKKHHYDWWVFPMHVPKKWNWPERNYHASINKAEAQTLLFDKDFVETYLCCITLYLNAIETLGWDDYPVRYARMLQSLALFLDAAKTLDEEDSIQARLCAVGQRSINYAKKELTALYPDYNLFTEGYDQVEAHLKYFKLSVAEKTELSVKINP